MGAPQTLPVRTETRGAVPDDAAESAARKVHSLLRMAHEPVLFARVKLTMAADPAVARPAVAQANVDLNGRPVRAQAAGETMNEAIDRMQDRLRIRLERSARNWAAIRGRAPVAETGEWRHQSVRAERPPHFPRPPEARALVRRKSYTLRERTPEQAIAEMELLDYDFHLFTERETGQDSVVYRTEHGYRLAQADPRSADLGPIDPAITVSDRSAPRLTPAAAAARLEVMGRPFLFFVDEDTGRGNLVYHRYDGHYGLITPAES